MQPNRPLVSGVSGVSAPVSVGAGGGSGPGNVRALNTRTNPIRKCASAAQDYFFRLFALSIGYCISGSNNLDDYQYVCSEACRDGKGAYVSSYFIMDVYEIVDTQTFQDSISAKGVMNTLPVATGSNTISVPLGSGGAAGLYTVI